MWREFFSQTVPTSSFFPPADPRKLAEIEVALGVALPGDLHALLLETDGVMDNLALERDGVVETIPNIHLVFPADEILRTNRFFRSDYRDVYMPFNHLLIFGPAGNGDCFMFPIVNGTVRERVFAWNHEDDSRNCVAPSLKVFVEWWHSGRIKL